MHTEYEDLGPEPEMWCCEKCGEDYDLSEQDYCPVCGLEYRED